MRIVTESAEEIRALVDDVGLYQAARLLGTCVSTLKRRLAGARPRLTSTSTVNRELVSEEDLYFVAWEVAVTRYKQLLEHGARFDPNTGRCVRWPPGKPRNRLVGLTMDAACEMVRDLRRGLRQAYMSALPTCPDPDAALSRLGLSKS